MNKIKVKESPSYVSTRNIVDEKGEYVAGCKTKAIAEKIVSLWNRKISEEITKEFFTLGKMTQKGFKPLPAGNVIISVTDLQEFVKAISVKIAELEHDCKCNL